VRALRATVSQIVRQVPRALLATWTTVVCVLVLVPVTLTLAREPRFEASIEAIPTDARVSQGALTASVRRIVQDWNVSEGAVRNDQATVTPAARSVLVRVWGRTPEEADGVADALEPRLVRAARSNGEPMMILGPRRLAGPTHAVDRVVGALPGPFPRRPDPAWAGLAGFLVALLACSAIALIWDRGRPVVPTKPTE
jgi:hypothetical protein